MATWRRPTHCFSTAYSAAAYPIHQRTTPVTGSRRRCHHRLFQRWRPRLARLDTRRSPPFGRGHRDVRQRPVLLRGRSSAAATLRQVARPSTVFWRPTTVAGSSAEAPVRGAACSRYRPSAVNFIVISKSHFSVINNIRRIRIRIPSPDPDCRSVWLSKCNRNFSVQAYIYEEIFMKIRPVFRDRPV